jgi:hypothetical protein
MATKSKAAAGDKNQFFDAQGRAVSSKEESLAIAAGPGSRTAYFELHNGAGVTWDIEVFFTPQFPYTITGGTIRGTICSSPSWKVTGGTMGPSITINGSNVCPSSGCASSVTIVGKCQCPPSYNGTYGFNGSSTMFNHSLLFRGYAGTR